MASSSVTADLDETEVCVLKNPMYFRWINLYLGHAFMRLSVLLVFPILYLPITAWAQGCPPGQYQIGGQGAIACAPIPQGSSQETAPAPRPLGKWINTWGAVAIGSTELQQTLGVTTGKLSKSDAESDALARCARSGAKNCQIGLAYFNQCVAVGEPQIDGKPNITGRVQFFGNASREKAAAAAQGACEARNPENQCKIIYNACTDQIFQYF